MTTSTRRTVVIAVVLALVGTTATVVAIRLSGPHPLRVADGSTVGTPAFEDGHGYVAPTTIDNLSDRPVTLTGLDITATEGITVTEAIGVMYDLDALGPTSDAPPPLSASGRAAWPPDASGDVVELDGLTLDPGTGVTVVHRLQTEPMGTGELHVTTVRYRQGWLPRHVNIDVRSLIGPDARVD